MVMPQRGCGLNVAEHRLLPRFRADVERIVHRKRGAKILLETGGDVNKVKKTHTGRAGGDRRQLRGIPVIGPGVGGTQPGTDPSNVREGPGVVSP